MWHVQDGDNEKDPEMSCDADPRLGCVVTVQGLINRFRGQLQLHVHRICEFTVPVKLLS